MAPRVHQSRQILRLSQVLNLLIRLPAQESSSVWIPSSRAGIRRNATARARCMSAPPYARRSLPASNLYCQKEVMVSLPFIIEPHQLTYDLQPSFPRKLLLSYSPPNPITRTSSRAPTCPASPTPKLSPRTSPPNERHTRLRSKAAATASTPHSRRLQVSYPLPRHKSMVNLAAWPERVRIS